MTPDIIIAQAAADGISLAVSESGNIKAVGGGNAVQRWAPLLRQHKDSILQVLRETETPCGPSRFDFDQYEERAGIMEHDGGLSRNDAERLAADAQGWDIRLLRRRRLLH